MMTRSVNLLAMLLLLAVSSLSMAEILVAPSCSYVTTAVAPCLPFLKGNTGNPSSNCCNGVKDIAKQAKSKADRQSICECLKTALAKVGSYDPSRVPLIANKCGVDMKIPKISGKTDCSRDVTYHFN